ncbi:hypothetical protein CBA19CS22_06505 [Caballeronia novacaledonica]|uniref:Uncharacterized protein n=1 Tax=Caballeronia novacaledonica TaxID=1544861 RepID=A0ACB5QMS5_9BURK|nr:hypothetical protein CBA19CS22_06505 [Caballeronia novacaledonica]
MTAMCVLASGLVTPLGCNAQATLAARRGAARCARA